MSFAEYLEAVGHYHEQSPTLRFGQSCMNVLFVFRPILYSAITGTHVDPFYDNGNIGAFFDYIVEKW